MTKLVRSLLVVGLALAFLLVPASTAAAQTSCPSCLVWNAPDYLTPDEDKLIPAGFPSFGHAEDCVEREDCQELEGVAFVTEDISDEMEDYDGYAQFTVMNGYHSSATTYWLVVSYDENGTIEDWWYDTEADWGLIGELGPGARELRLFPVQSAATEYHLDVYVE